jgi:hypothetical protein
MIFGRKVFFMKEYFFTNGWLYPAVKLPNIHGKPFSNALIIRRGEKIVALQSYDTIVLIFDYEHCRVARTWNSYSATTMRHINAFMANVGFPNCNGKKWFEGLPFLEWVNI